MHLGSFKPWIIPSCTFMCSSINKSADTLVSLTSLFAAIGDKHAIPNIISCWMLIFDYLIRNLEKSTRSISKPHKSILNKRTVVYWAVNQHHLLIYKQLILINQHAELFV